MVTPSDPYQFILSESVVSSSQEEILKRIPGWDDAKLNDSLTPSQPPLAASQQPDNLKLSVSASSDSEDASSHGDAFTLYGVPGPMEWASPDTEQEKEGDSYDAAFESDRSQPPSSLRQCDGFILAELLSTRFITQSQVGTENVYESQPSSPKDMTQCLKMDKFLQGANARERAVDYLAEEGRSRDTSFKIREFGRGSNSVVPAETKGPRDSEKTCSTRIHRKTTPVKKCPQSLQPEQPCHIPRSSEPSSAMEAAERFTEVCAEAKRDAGTSTDERGLVRQCRPECEDLTFKDADVIKPDVAVEMPEDPVHVHQTSFDDFTESKSTSSLRVSACERGDNRRKRTTVERKFDSAVSMHKKKAPKHVNSIQGQAETSSYAINNQGLPEVVKKVASHETQQSQGCTQLGESANNDPVKNVSVEKCQLLQPTCSAGFPEDQDSGRSMIPPATELKCTRKTEKADRGKSCSGQSGDNKQSTNGRDVMIFPESVIDVVTLCSGCLPLCKPDDPDFLSLVIGSGVSLPLPFRRGQLQ